MTFKITPEAKTLFDALIKNGVFAELEYYDGNKHVDIFVPSAKLYIEVDGLPHFLDPHKIAIDLVRDHYSYINGFGTFRIPNIVIQENLQKVVKALVKLIKDKSGPVQ